MNEHSELAAHFTIDTDSGRWWNIVAGLNPDEPGVHPHPVVAQVRADTLSDALTALAERTREQEQL